jgi:hypothetical protein
MKRNKDYLYFILTEIEDDYSEAVTFKQAFQKWIDMEPRSKDESKDFIYAHDLLISEGFVQSKNITVAGTAVMGLLVMTWKGLDLLEELRAK